MFHQQRNAICFEDVLDLALGLFIGNIGLVVERQWFFSAFVFVLFHVVDVGQTVNLFPSTDCLKDGHVLVIWVVTCPKTGKDVFKGIEPLPLVFMESEERFEELGM